MYEAVYSLYIYIYTCIYIYIHTCIYNMYFNIYILYIQTNVHIINAACAEVQAIVKTYTVCLIRGLCPPCYSLTSAGR